ncbi:hypothetical protein PDE_05923 [Penicillium oxalicum 114-2]|uniref:Uncharacterized protein n=1 Tax=Penicillium oxalicum (strain 114-2 / CGMCC 5302) TaxID=933388 RepID=S7ZKY3_PENO1|nr:hypothetical protein PDE_05923 [Penicillium oxalicum 114-2]
MTGMSPVLFKYRYIPWAAGPTVNSVRQSSSNRMSVVSGTIGVVGGVGVTWTQSETPSRAAVRRDVNFKYNRHHGDQSLDGDD